MSDDKPARVKVKCPGAGCGVSMPPIALTDATQTVRRRCWKCRSQWTAVVRPDGSVEWATREARENQTSIEPTPPTSDAPTAPPAAPGELETPVRPVATTNPTARAFGVVCESEGWLWWLTSQGTLTTRADRALTLQRERAEAIAARFASDPRWTGMGRNWRANGVVEETP